MENPLSVANYFIQKSLDTGISVTPMKLIKLVYIAHGWHLGLTGEPLIGEGVQAWRYGPVIKSVYDEFKKWGYTGVTKLAETGSSYFSISDNRIKQFLDKIWEQYSKYDGLQLSAMSHAAGTPWFKSWHENGGKNYFGFPIPNDLIEQHYKTKVTKKK